MQKSLENIHKIKQDQKIYQKKLKRLDVVAKVSGYYLASELLEKIGTQMPEGSQLGTIIDMNKMLVVFTINQNQIHLVKKDTILQSKFNSIPSKQYDCIILDTRILGEKRMADTQYEVRALLHNLDHKLRPGMSGLGKYFSGYQSCFEWCIRWLKTFLRIDLFL